MSQQSNHIRGATGVLVQTKHEYVSGWGGGSYIKRTDVVVVLFRS